MVSPAVVDLTRELAAEVPFAEAAYRDGEFRCIMGDRGETVNGERYCPELQEALIETLMHPTGQRCAFFDKPANIQRRASQWIAANRPPVTWVPDRVWMQAVVAGEAAPLFSAARRRNVVLCGPTHLERLPISVIEPTEYVPLPAHEAWRAADLLTDRIGEVVRSGDLVLIACGMATNLIVHRLWPQVEGATLYDIGAALDPFCGEYSRRIYRNRTWRASVMPLNLR